MDPQAIMFRDDGVLQCHSMLNTMDEDSASRLIARYGWKQRTFKERKNVYSVDEMKVDRYYTIYTKTAVGFDSALIGECNHPDVSKVNLSAITHGGGQKYVIQRSVGTVLSEQEVDALLLGLDGNIKIEKVSKCLKRGIAFGLS